MSKKNKVIPERQVLVQGVYDFLDKSKALDIVVVDLLHKSSVADFMVIASGTSSRHVKGLAEKLAEFLKEKGIQNIKLEGLNLCDWVLIDAGDVIIHLFRPEIREFYNLEKMWESNFDLLAPSPHSESSHSELS